MSSLLDLIPAAKAREALLRKTKRRAYYRKNKEVILEQKYRSEKRRKSS
jgi:hypothetical protein